MTTRQENERKRTVFSASNVLGEIADALTTIRLDDGLTFSDMAAVLGRSDDMAAKYCDGTAEMGVIAYARAKREWNGRFTGGIDRLCEDSRPATASDRTHGSRLLKAALAVSEALEDDEAVTAREVRKHRHELEDARDAIEELLRRVPVRAVRERGRSA